ncbi:MAG: hypothetical protein NDI80_05325 [Flavobacteriaceae bacterium]|nr:hypothetical protein [Flavobacteriaceae bacterium]
MKAVTIKKLKTELSQQSTTELTELILRLSKFKKENKELLTYLLFEADHEDGYIDSIKIEIDEQFKTINTKTAYLIKKSVRKILRFIKTNIKYSKKKETEVELLLYFCYKLSKLNPSIKLNPVLKNLYQRELESIKKKCSLLHEDLQFDYQLEIQSLNL